MIESTFLTSLKSTTPVVDSSNGLDLSTILLYGAIGLTVIGGCYVGYKVYQYFAGSSSSDISLNSKNMLEAVDQVEEEVVDQTINQVVEEAVDQTINQMVEEAADQTMDRVVEEILATASLDAYRMNLLDAILDSIMEMTQLPFYASRSLFRIIFNMKNELLTLNIDPLLSKQFLEYLQTLVLFLDRGCCNLEDFQEVLLDLVNLCFQNPENTFLMFKLFEVLISLSCLPT